MAEKTRHTYEYDVGEKTERKDPEFNEIEARRDFDRKKHEERAKEAGVPDDVAREHADEDVADGARDEASR